MRYSARINGLDAIALTKLDVLDGLPEVRICTGYRTPAGVVTEFPADLRLLADAEPVYETMPGWSTPTKGATRIEELPAEARRYIKRLEEVSGVVVRRDFDRLRSQRDDRRARFAGGALDRVAGALNGSAVAPSVLAAAGAWFARPRRTGLSDLAC